MSFGLDFPGYFNAVGDFFFGRSPAAASARKALADKDLKKYDPLVSPLVDPILGAAGLKDAMSGYSASKAAAASGPTFAQLTADKPSSQPQVFDYLDAPYASAYGMSKETAYSEAMENTSYRRSVADMQKAGLNPAVIFGAGRGSTAGSPSYISSGSSGSSGGASRRGSGRGRSNGKLFSGSAYSVISALGGIVGAAATKTGSGYWLGTSLAQGAMSALNLLNRK